MLQQMMVRFLHPGSPRRRGWGVYDVVPPEIFHIFRLWADGPHGPDREYDPFRGIRIITSQTLYPRGLKYPLFENKPLLSA